MKSRFESAAWLAAPDAFAQVVLNLLRYSFDASVWGLTWYLAVPILCLALVVEEDRIACGTGGGGDHGPGRRYG